jgi:Tol biopolymer transport system component
MSLAPGSRIGVYDITEPLGEGGMGQVWRATDSTLGRQVAIKILPDAFATDAERLARFEREAKTLASLNHPHIAAIYGFEKSSGMHALVMELVEGEDLSQRIARGALAPEEALPIARQIAEALEAAHQQGIIHRDLKPANIKVREDGTVKVLDFGLAKAMDPAAASSPGVSMSPTITTPAMTQAGVVLGTAAYMSPEQARGKFVDRRADIWAFGAVLFEMLAGRRPFDGEDTTEVLGAVVRLDPQWNVLPATVPARITQVLRACLQKDPKRRLGDMQSVRLALEGAFETAAPSPVAQAQQSGAAARALPWAVAGAALIAAGVVVMLWAPWRPAPALRPQRLFASVGSADTSLAVFFGASAALSPDGTTLAFIGQQPTDVRRLFIRKLDQLQAAPLAGTEAAGDPFFSPDGQWIAFFAGAKLKKVSVTGGAAVSLCDAPSGRGGAWLDDDTILFTAVSGTNTTLTRVSAAGGTPVAFGVLSDGATAQRWPHALPGGKAVLYTEHSRATAFDAANVMVAPLAGGPAKLVVRGGYFGRYVSSGHLIYMQQGTLFAVAFDLDRLETIGQAVPAVEGVAAAPASGSAQLAVSAEGTLVYLPGATLSDARPLHWLTRDGKPSVLRATAAQWANARFSPDGQKLALEIFDGKQWEIWIYEWARDTLTQLTFDQGEDRFPVWTPDGRRIAFASDRGRTGILNWYWVNADGTGEVTRLTDSPNSVRQGSWHPSGRFFAFQATRGGTFNDLMLLPMEDHRTRGWTPGTPTVFLGTPADETWPQFSPDGRWMAYASNETGRNEVYVRPFPGPGGKWRISIETGGVPRWSATTSELLFRRPTTSGQIMVASYSVVGEAFRASTPQLWSPTVADGWNAQNSAYDLHPDGKRVAASAADVQANEVLDKLIFVFNFADYLRTIAPPNK